MTDYNRMALQIIESEKSRVPYLKPLMTRAIILWRNKHYLGGFLEIAPRFSREIIYLSKYSKPLPDGLDEMIRKFDSQRLCLTVDSGINLNGRGHALRLTNKTHCIRLTPEQALYILKHPFPVIEI